VKPVDVKPLTPNEVVQPTVVPKEVPKAPAAPEGDGVDGGVDGGVEGGVEGGVIGGVVGGVLGGTLGGVLGGVEGGTSTDPVPLAPDMDPPERILKVEPVYPEMARKARIQGRVVLQAIINEDGDVEGVTVLKGNPMLDESAIQAVRKWKYKPARQNGRPVKIYFTIQVEFTLN
jgi:protein TonB